MHSAPVSDDCSDIDIRLRAQKRWELGQVLREQFGEARVYRRACIVLLAADGMLDQRGQGCLFAFTVQSRWSLRRPRRPRSHHGSTSRRTRLS